ncbi:MAG: hypothetical protein U9N35_02170 [Euryarchaeota archaeon]|nr:hypothetical protein [Euryarchaeota archaeon]
MKEWLIVLLLLGGSVNIHEAERVYDQYLDDRDLAQDDTITLCYEGLFFLYLYKENNNPTVLDRGERCLDIIIERQRDSGEITNDPNVNSKLYTGVGTWALSLGYDITGKEKYKKAALRGGNFLIEEIEAWKRAYPMECPDERNENARHNGEVRNSLENYCYSCPNDWGLICAGLGGIVHHTGEEGRYYEYAVLLGETLYRMQLENGAWYDGYALKIPTRWDISCHYVTMAVLGEWISYTITGDEKYRDSVEKAVRWMESMQSEKGVYDIYITERNFPHAKENFVGDPQQKCDFKQLQGKTNVKRYYPSPGKTMLGEYSLFLAETLAGDIGIETNREETFEYIKGKHGYSHWYILSLVLKEERSERNKTEKNIIGYILIGVIAAGLIGWMAKKRKNGKE